MFIKDKIEKFQVRNKDLVVRMATEKDFQDLMEVYKQTIRRAFEDEGVGHLEDFILQEFDYKEKSLRAFYQGQDKRHILLAELEGQVVGTISFGPLGKETRDNVEADFPSEGELGGMYILPDFQGMGLASILIKRLIHDLDQAGIQEVSFDSGYELAQAKWIKKFGPPLLEIKDYWGPEADHMIWLCKIKDLKS